MSLTGTPRGNRFATAAASRWMWESGTARLRGREPVGDDGHTCSLSERDFENVSHALEGARRRVVEALHASAEYRRMRYNGDLHPGHIQVQSEFQRPVTLRTAVEPTHL